MAKALGVGGVFFRSSNPRELCEWYEKWLGFKIETEADCSAFMPDTMPPGGATVWGVFDKDTSYFGPSGQPFMVNLVVDDLAEALVQVAEGGAEVVGDVEEHVYGKFGWFIDPNGNKVELWEPTPQS